MLNMTVIQGRLTKDVELRHTQSGTAVASFTVAWSEKYKEQERKLFLPCVAWSGTAEFISKYFSKGDQIIVDGYLTTRDWTDQNGNKRQATELTVNKAHFAGSKSTTESTTAFSATPTNENTSTVAEFEEIPMTYENYEPLPWE